MTIAPRDTLEAIPPTLLGKCLKEYLADASTTYGYEGFTHEEGVTINKFLDDLAVYIKERGVMKNDV